MSAKVCGVQSTQGMASAFRTMSARAYAFRMTSPWEFCLPDAKCKGVFPPDDAHHGICFPDDQYQDIAFWTTCAMAFCVPNAECQGIFLPDDECQGMWRPDDVRHDMCFPDGACQGICLADDQCQGILPSRRGVSRHISCRRLVSGHLPSGYGVARHIYLCVPPHILPDSTSQCTCHCQHVLAMRMCTRRRWA